MALFWRGIAPAKDTQVQRHIFDTVGWLRSRFKDYEDPKVQIYTDGSGGKRIQDKG